MLMQILSTIFFRFLLLHYNGSASFPPAGAKMRFYHTAGRGMATKNASIEVTPSCKAQIWFTGRNRSNVSTTGVTAQSLEKRIMTSNFIFCKSENACAEGISKEWKYGRKVKSAPILRWTFMPLWNNNAMCYIFQRRRKDMLSLAHLRGCAGGLFEIRPADTSVAHTGSHVYSVTSVAGKPSDWAKQRSSGWTHTAILPGLFIFDDRFIVG